MLNYLIEYVSRKSFPYINNVRQVDPLKRFMVKFLDALASLESVIRVTEGYTIFS